MDLERERDLERFGLFTCDRWLCFRLDLDRERVRRLWLRFLDFDLDLDLELDLDSLRIFVLGGSTSSSAFSLSFSSDLFFIMLKKSAAFNLRFSCNSLVDKFLGFSVEPALQSSSFFIFSMFESSQTLLFGILAAVGFCDSVDVSSEKFASFAFVGFDIFATILLNRLMFSAVLNFEPNSRDFFLALSLAFDLDFKKASKLQFSSD